MVTKRNKIKVIDSIKFKNQYKLEVRPKLVPRMTNGYRDGYGLYLGDTEVAINTDTRKASLDGIKFLLEQWAENQVYDGILEYDKILKESKDGKVQPTK